MLFKLIIEKALLLLIIFMLIIFQLIFFFYQLIRLISPIELHLLFFEQ